MVWQNDAQCAAIITFDFDGETMWDSRVQQGHEGFDKPPVASLGQYGATVVPRLLDLLAKYDIPSGWFVPGRTAELHPDLVQRIHEEGHELGHHGYSHINPVAMSDEEEYEEFRQANEVFDDLINETPVGFRSPAADMGKRTLERLSDLGFEYDSSLMGSDFPYFLETDDSPLVELPWYWSQDDAPHFNYNMSPPVSYQNGLSSPSEVLDIWKAEFDACYEDGVLFHLVTHPQIIGRPHRRKMLAELLEHITSHSDVWVARPHDIAQYWRDSVPESNRDIRSI